MAASTSAVRLRINDVIRDAAGLYLGLPLCRSHGCVCCKAEMDEVGILKLS